MLFEFEKNDIILYIITHLRRVIPMMVYYTYHSAMRKSKIDGSY